MQLPDFCCLNTKVNFLYESFHWISRFFTVRLKKPKSMKRPQQFWNSMKLWKIVSSWTHVSHLYKTQQRIREYFILIIVSNLTWLKGPSLFHSGSVCGWQITIFVFLKLLLHISGEYRNCHLFSLLVYELFSCIFLRFK